MIRRPRSEPLLLARSVAFGPLTIPSNACEMFGNCGFEFQKIKKNYKKSSSHRVVVVAEFVSEAFFDSFIECSNAFEL